MLRRKLVSFTKRHGGSILAWLGVAGTITTTAMAIVNTREADKKLEELGDISTMEKVVEVLPTYIPTIISGAVTVTCILSGNRIHVKNTESLMMTCTALQNQYNAYRSVVIDKYGEEVDREIHEEIVRKYSNYHVIGLDTPDVKVTWEFMGDRFEAYEREVMDAEFHINRNYVLGGAITINGFRQMLGLSEKPGKDDELGWCINDEGIFWLDVYHVKKEGEDVYEIVPYFAPEDINEWL